jgi:hypothetical protein
MSYFHHNTARPYVSDGETASIYIWRVAENILSKSTRGGPSQVLGLGLILWYIVRSGNET